MAAQQEKETKKVVAKEVLDTGSEKKAEDELDAIIGEIESLHEEATKPVETASSETKKTKVANVTPIRSGIQAESQSLKLELTGSLNLRLLFSSGARSIDLTCEEDALVCRFADGTEFRIPLHDSAAIKKIA